MTGNRYGLYRASVVDNVDPDRRFRLLVSAPELSANPLGWAEACGISTQDSVPGIGDIVWIMFEAGDVDRPVWLGSHPARAP